MIPSTWQMLNRRLSAPSPRCVHVCSTQSPRAWDTQLRCCTFMSFAGHRPDVRRWQQERPELPNRSRWEARMELSSTGLFLCVEALYVVLDRCEPCPLMLTLLFLLSFLAGCLATWCPCMAYSRNRQHLRSLQIEGTPLPPSSERMIDAYCCIYSGLFVVLQHWTVQVRPCPGCASEK
jgi:hypothetical protein